MDEFFHTKRPWSKYKDLILEYYLHPYIPKVAKLGRTVLIVDCCAGPGAFGDGSKGSPLIIAEQIRQWQGKGNSVSGLFIEGDPDHFASLESNLAPFGDATTAIHGMFGDQLHPIKERAAKESVFLYVDPYSVKGLDYSPMKNVYDQIQHHNSSVEVLLNFNVTTFMRWALAAMKRAAPDIEPDDPDYLADDPNERVEIVTLNSIAGGDYWQQIATNRDPFPEKLDQMMTGYADRLNESFRYVCWYPVKSKYRHTTPKYILVFGTRHTAGLELMNDAMCKARENFLGAEFNPPGALFDTRPEGEIADMPKLKDDIVTIVSTPMTRKEVRLKVLQSYFCRASKSEINRAIRHLLQENRLFSSTGSSRINDTVLLTTNQQGLG